MTSSGSSGDRVTLAVAGAIGLVYALAVIALGPTCPPVLFRWQNVTFVLVAVLAAAAMIVVGWRREGGYPLAVGELGAGLSAGLWLQPSTGLVVAVLVVILAGLELRRAVSAASLALATLAILAGIVLGMEVQAGLAGAVRC